MLTAVYDLNVSPPTYDVATFLVSAEAERIARGHDQLQMVIAPGREAGFRRDHLPPRDPAVRQVMLERIVMAMPKLLPSCAGVAMLDKEPTGARFPEGWSLNSRSSHYGLGHAAKFYREGFAPLRSPDEPVRRKKLVTITLREAHYWPTRNSNRAAWLALAGKLQAAGYTVVLVPDAESAFKAEGFVVDVKASYDLVHRAKLYESAHLNLGVSNGPTWMAAYLERANFLIFKVFAQGSVCVDPEFYAQCGFPVGSQLARPGFRIAWADDDEKTITRETFAALESTAG